jgi:hypothetical protein
VSLLVALSACGAAGQTAQSTTQSTTQSAAQPGEPVIEAAAIGPLTKATDLQIVSVFAYEPGETLISPATEIAGFIAEARTGRGYGARALEPLVVEPTPATIAAHHLLVIAWGPRSEFSLDRATAVGHAAMAEAIQRGAADMAYAPIARDQGVTSINADDVAAAFIAGAVTEFLEQRRAHPDRPIALQHVTYEAGPPYIDAVKKAVAAGVAAAHRPVTASQAGH